MNILYISSLLHECSSGGAVVSNSNYNLLKSLNMKCDIHYFKLSSSFGRIKFISKMNLIINAMMGYSGQLNFFSKLKILYSKNVKQADVVWLDSSLYGCLAVSIKAKYPDKKIICFFHNVENDFYNYLSSNRSKLFKVIVRSAILNEKLSVSICDALITLTMNDSERLYELYGKKASFYLPVTLDEPNKHTPNLSEVNKPLLFVGSDFPPNIEAIDFLCKHVMPYTNKKLVIVGKGLEFYRDKYQSKNVSVVGTVDDLGEYYINSELVLCPIFSGAGMKVKVAEALSYGKKIVGTSFAFVGYDTSRASEFMFIAETSDDYLKILKGDFDSFDLNSYEHFINSYSRKSKASEIETLLETL